MVTIAPAAPAEPARSGVAPQAVEACARFALVLADAIAGRDWREALDCQETSDDLAIAAIIKGNWRSKGRLDIASSGYVIHSLEAAFWCVDQTETFRDAVLIAANLGVVIACRRFKTIDLERFHAARPVITRRPDGRVERSDYGTVLGRARCLASRRAR